MECQAQNEELQLENNSGFENLQELTVLRKLSEQLEQAKQAFENLYTEEMYLNDLQRKLGEELASGREENSVINFVLNEVYNDIQTLDKNYVNCMGLSLDVKESLKEQVGALEELRMQCNRLRLNHGIPPLAEICAPSVLSDSDAHINDFKSIEFYNSEKLKTVEKQESLSNKNAGGKNNLAPVNNKRSTNPQHDGHSKTNNKKIKYDLPNSDQFKAVRSTNNPSIYSKQYEKNESSIPRIGRYNKISDPELIGCQAILTAMLKSRYCEAFKCSVDSEALQKLGLPDYHSIIEHPIDFSIISSKLSESKYKSRKSFYADVQLLFSNCYKYNTPEYAVYGDCEKMEKLFNKKRMEFFNE